MKIRKLRQYKIMQVMVSVLIRKVRSKVIANLASKMLVGTFPESTISEYSKEIPASDDIKETPNEGLKHANYSSCH